MKLLAHLNALAVITWTLLFLWSEVSAFLISVAIGIAGVKFCLWVAEAREVTA